MQYQEYDEEMALGLMAGHTRTQHVRTVEGRQSWAASPPGEELRTYRLALPTVGGLQSCIVEGCPRQAKTRTAIHAHFLHRHVQGTVAILEEGNLPHPQCLQCNMLVPSNILNGRHHATVQCARGA